MIGRYAIESTKPKVFDEAVNFKGAVEDGDWRKVSMNPTRDFGDSGVMMLHLRIGTDRNRFWPSGALARSLKPEACVSMGAE
jgi:hypothetical protein